VEGLAKIVASILPDTHALVFGLRIGIIGLTSYVTSAMWNCLKGSNTSALLFMDLRRNAILRALHLFVLLVGVGALLGRLWIGGRLGRLSGTFRNGRTRDDG